MTVWIVVGGPMDEAFPEDVAVTVFATRELAERFAEQSGGIVSAQKIITE